MKKFDPKTFRYIPQLLARRDAIGNVRNVSIRYDNDAGTFVATIRSKRQQRMAGGMISSPILTTGEGRSPTAAADSAMERLAL